MFSKSKKQKEMNLAEYYEAERKNIISESEAIRRLYEKKSKKIRRPNSISSDF